MSAPIRSYGGWRERRGFGIGSLSGRQTAIGLAVVIGVLFALLLAPAIAPVLIVAAGLLAGSVLIRIRGESVWAVAVRHVLWFRTQQTGRTEYSAWTTRALPGPLAALEVFEVDDVGLIHNPQSRTLTTVVPLEPAGADFVDAEQMQSWQQGWDRWLSHLGYVSEVRHVAVIIDSGPVPAMLSPPPGSDMVDQIMAELDRMTASDVRATTLVSITLGYDGDAQKAVARALEVVAGTATLDQCGVGVLPAWSPGEVLSWIRDCFEPAWEHGEVSGLPDARPTAAQERWDSYRHDGAVSASFMWDESPGENLARHVLLRLFGPADYGKRICLVYEPVAAHEAAREVDRQAEAAVFRSQYRRRLGRDETARERLDIERARQTASDQAHGRGLVDVGLYATVTAKDEQALAMSAADLHNRAGECRVRLRRAYGTQLAAFITTLGVGFVPDRSW